MMAADFTSQYYTEELQMRIHFLEEKIRELANLSVGTGGETGVYDLCYLQSEAFDDVRDLVPEDRYYHRVCHCRWCRQIHSPCNCIECRYGPSTPGTKLRGE